MGSASRRMWWGPLAEIGGKYLHKGKQVYIEGKIQNRSYDGRDGKKIYITEIVANEMQMLGRAGDTDKSSSSGPRLATEDDSSTVSYETSPYPDEPF
jgi:single-strand DNA-binding protein